MNTIDFKIQTGDALLIVDVQNDFCPGGALAIDEGDAIVPELNQWIRYALALDMPIFASRDWHPKNHKSFKDQGGEWPRHCIQDTDGAKFHPGLGLPENTVVITKGVRFDKDQQSVFDDTGLTELLKKKNIKRLLVGGLALDVCVLESVLAAIREGFSVYLIRNATQPVTREGGEAALARMTEAGAQILETPGPPGPAFCNKALEWAEHARLEDDDDACDDGRAGRVFESG